MNNQAPDPPSLLTLSPVLLRKFKTLSGGDVKTFKQMFIALWRWLWPISRFDVVLLAYNLPVVLDQALPHLTVHQYFMLAKLYLLSGGGSQAVNSRHYKFRGMENQHIKLLMRFGLLTRTSFDPAHPYLVKPSHINKTYISLTTSGIAFHKLVVKELHRLSHNDVYLLALGQKETSQ